MKKIITLILITSFLGVIPAFADSKRYRPKKKSGKKHRVVKTSTNTDVIQTANPISTPNPTVDTTAVEGKIGKSVTNDEVKIIPQKSVSELKSGNVAVEVTSNDNYAAQLGLAPRALIMLEFPADDPLYSVYTGDRDYVDTFCLRKGENGECLDGKKSTLILAPGKEFHNWSNGIETTTVVTVQRVSGLTFTFFVVPVKSVAQNANHVVIRYNVKEVIDSRLRNGLVTNLDESSVKEKEKIEMKNQETVEATKVGEKVENVEPALSLEEICVKQLKEVADSQKLRFQKPVHGLSLAVSQSGSRLNDVAIEVVAVRNVLNAPIKLVPGEPRLFVETIADGKKVNAESLKVLHVATSADDNDILQPGEVYYYAFAYKTPILGAKQFLRVSFAQTDAADEPATAILSGYNR